MAKNKIERIDQEIAKTREKIAEQQEKLKALEDPGPAVRHAVWRHGARPGGASRRSRTGGHDP